MFELTEDTLQLMWKRCNYQLPTDEMIFFGIRGCLPVQHGGTEFAASHKVEIASLDYLHMRCTLGQWKPGSGLALYPASTVPKGSYVRSRIPHGGRGANQLMLGHYKHRKGLHRAGKPTGHRAFRQHGWFPVWRTSDDVDYDLNDDVDMRSEYIVWDNIHCGWSNGPSHPTYSSAGCQVVAGYPKCSKRGSGSRDTGPWKKFVERAYARNQTVFRYGLFSGHEVQNIATIGSGELSQNLRFGSEGDLVEVMQQSLNDRGFDAGQVDGKFGFNGLSALMAFQRSVFGDTGDDGILGPMTADELGMDLPTLASVDDSPAAAPATATALATEMAPAARLDELLPTSAAATPAGRISISISSRTEGGKQKYYASSDLGEIMAGRKVSYLGKLGLTNLYDKASIPGGVYDNVAAHADHGDWAHMIWPTGIGESDGYFCCLNTYDRAHFTIGFSQLAAHTPNNNLILLYRRLLALPSSSYYLPDLKLVGGKVHQILSSGATRNLEKPKNGELRRFMKYLNPARSTIEDSEAEQAARLMFWAKTSDEFQREQIALTVEIARNKLRRAVSKGVSLEGRPLRYAIWCFDILHQGRGGVKYWKLENALQSSSPEAALMKFGWSGHKNRIKAVRKSINKLASDGTLDVDGINYGTAPFN